MTLSSPRPKARACPKGKDVVVAKARDTESPDSKALDLALIPVRQSDWPMRDRNEESNAFANSSR